MRTLFILALAIVVSASSAFGQTPPPPGGGSVGGTRSMTDIIIDLRVSNNSPRVGDQVEATWRIADSHLTIVRDKRVTIDMVNGPETTRIGEVAATAGSYRFTVDTDKVGTIRTAQSFKLRVRMEGAQSEIDITVRPANSRPRIQSLDVPNELVAGRDPLVVNGVVTDDDNDPLEYRIQRYVSTVNEWRNVNGPSSSLPMSLAIGEVPAEVFVQFRLQVSDGSALTEHRDFEVLLLPIPAVLPDPIPSDPLPAEPEAAPVASATAPAVPDLAPVASATGSGVASVTSANNLPSGLRVRVRPSAQLTGGQTIGLYWVGQDMDGDPLRLVLRYRNLSDGVAVVQSSSESPFELSTPYVAARRVLEVEVSLSDGKGESERQVVELVLMPVDRIVVNEREFKEDIRVDRPTMARRMEEAGMFSPGAIGHELVEDADGNMTVRPVAPPPRRK